ncbi:MAG: hypothetical protein ACFB9M_06070 [Myxococcota bacterium]
MRCLCLVALVLAGCMPPSVQAVDQLMRGLQSSDVEKAAAAVHPTDRALLRTCMEARERDPRSLEALALPPDPLKHHIVEIEQKTDEGHIVLVEMTLKNPLPYASKKIGQELTGFPETRVVRRRFLSEPLGDEIWGVRLDLEATLERARFVQHIQSSLENRDFEEVERALQKVPPPPRTPDAQAGSDRLVDTLRTRLKEARTHRPSAAHDQTPPAPRPD